MTGRPAVPPPRLTVVVPAYREERRLPASLARLPRALDAVGLPPLEVIVVDDGSDDGTARVVDAAAALDPRIVRRSHRPNRGKGYAVRIGVAAARGDWILVTDADLSTPPEDAAALFRATRAGTAIAIGSRRVRGARIEVRQPLHREVLGFGFSLLRRLLVLPTIRDTQCGFKLFRADLARRLFAEAREDGWVYDVEILALARRHRLRVAEVPVHWSDDPRSQVVAAHAAPQMARGLLRLFLRRLAFLGARRPAVPPAERKPSPPGT